MEYRKNGVGIASPIKVITGQSLVHRKLTKQQRAVLAASVIDGLARFEPTVKQVAENFGVSLAYINVARGLSPLKRAAILAGWDQSTSFAELLRHQPVLLAPKAENGNGVDDTVLENIACHTPDRLWHALQVAESRMAAV